MNNVSEEYQFRVARNFPARIICTTVVVVVTVVGNSAQVHISRLTPQFSFLRTLFFL